MKLIKTELSVKDEAQLSIMACMETGNIDRARTIITELGDVDTAAAQSISMDVLATYGILLV